ncbi:hypothetical protein ACKFKG_00295 [Phormidesmis sp. 146-35]
MSFSAVVEAIKVLSFEEKQEIQTLLAQYLREERREELHQNYQTTIVEQNGELKFSSNINELKQLIED